MKETAACLAHHLFSYHPATGDTHQTVPEAPPKELHPGDPEHDDEDGAHDRHVADFHQGQQDVTGHLKEKVVKGTQSSDRRSTIQIQTMHLLFICTPD